MHFAEIPESCEVVDFKVFIVLKSRDGKWFQLSRAAAKSCKMLAAMFDNADEDDEIKLPVDCDAKTLALVIQYCEYHKDSKPAALPQPLQKHIDDYLDQWDKVFIYTHLVIKGDETNHEALLQVMAAADYFDNDDLRNLCCAQVASMIQDKNPEQIRDLFDLPDDFTPAQRARNAEELKALAELVSSSGGASALLPTSSNDDGGVPWPEHSSQSPNNFASSPLRNIVFIQKVALFAGTTPKKALQLIYVAPEWREAVFEYTFGALLSDPFVKPLLQQTPSTSSTEKEKEIQQQNEQKTLELFKQFRKVVPFLLQHVSLTDEEKDKIVMRMKLILASLFDLVHNRRNDNNNNNNNNNGDDDDDDDNDENNNNNDSNYVTNAGYHQEVASFLSADSLRFFLRIDDLHDLIINHIAPHVTAIGAFGRLICDIVRDEQSAVLFANVESFSAILNCFRRSKTSSDVRVIATSTFFILFLNPSSNKILNSLPVVEAFSFVLPLADDADAVEWISRALKRILRNNEESQKKFGTPEFFKIVQGMEKHATTDNSKKPLQDVLGFVDPSLFSKPLVDATDSSGLKSAVDSLPRHGPFYTEEVRNTLIDKKNLIVDAETADSAVKFLDSFSRHESHRPLLRTSEVKELIINHIAPHVTAIEVFGTLISDIVQNRQSAELFSNVESFNAILECFHRSKTSQDAWAIASSVNNILEHNPTSKEILNALRVVDAFTFVIPIAKDGEIARRLSNRFRCISNTEAVQKILDALARILENNEEAQQKFGTPEFLEVFQGMEVNANRSESLATLKNILKQSK
jgi:S-phase kinase-associated protein 1